VELAESPQLPRRPRRKWWRFNGLNGATRSRGPAAWLCFRVGHDASPFRHGACVLLRYL